MQRLDEKAVREFEVVCRNDDLTRRVVACLDQGLDCFRHLLYY